MRAPAVFVTAPAVVSVRRAARCGRCSAVAAATASVGLSGRRLAAAAAAALHGGQGNQKPRRQRCRRPCPPLQRGGSERKVTEARPTREAKLAGDAPAWINAAARSGIHGGDARHPNEGGRIGRAVGGASRQLGALLLALWLVLGAPPASVVHAGVVAPADGTPAAATAAAADNQRIFDDAVDAIAAMFYDTTGGMYALSREQLLALKHQPPTSPAFRSRETTYDAIRAVLGALHDEYSRFLDPSEFQAELHPRARAERLSGVGMSLTDPLDGNEVKEVVAPVPQSPAEAAGINPGDELLRVDEVDIESARMTADEAVALLRGPPGTDVRVVMRRPMLDAMVAGASTSLQPDHNDSDGDNEAAGGARPAPTTTLAAPAVPRETVHLTLRRSALHIPAAVAGVLSPHNAAERGGAGVGASGHAPRRIGYIRIHSFNDSATRTVVSALRQFASSRHVDGGIVLDLRNCMGGVFQDAMLIASLFLDRPDAPLVVTLDSHGIQLRHTVGDQARDDLVANDDGNDGDSIGSGKGGRGGPGGGDGGDGGGGGRLSSHRRRRLRAETPPPAQQTPQRQGSAPPLAPPSRFPLAVLVNRATASSAEVLAVALKENNRARVIGTPTYGKGRVQHYFPLSDGSALVLTIGEYLTPRSLEHIRPDIGVTPQAYCSAAPAPFARLVGGAPSGEGDDACVRAATAYLATRSVDDGERGVVASHAGE